MSATGDVVRVMDALRRSVQALRSADRTAKRELGVSAAQLFVLRRIADAPGVSLAELAERTHTAQSSVSEIVSRLVAAGFVEKSQAVQDRRRIVLQLTDQGRSITGKSAFPPQERLVAGLHNLTPEQRGDLADLLEAWLRAARLDDVPASMFFEPNFENTEPVPFSDHSSRRIRISSRGFRRERSRTAR